MTALQRMPRRRLLLLTAAVILVAELFAIVIDLGGDDAAEASVTAWLGLSLWGIALAALLLLVVLPRVDPAAWPTLALVFGVTALFTCVAFWSALPFAFGAAAIAASERGGSVGGVMGALGMTVAFALCIIA